MIGLRFTVAWNSKNFFIYIYVGEVGIVRLKTRQLEVV